MIELIHYTNKRNFEKIVGSGKIIPTRRFVYRDSDFFNELGRKACYFILSTDLPKWKKFRYYYNWLLYHVSESGDSVIEIRIRKNNLNDLFVIDRFYQQAYELMKKPEIQNDFRLEMSNNNAISIIPLKDYIKRFQGIYLLPEVISFSPVKLENYSFKLLI